MQALQFEATLTRDGEIVLPPEFAGTIPLGQPLRVVVMWDGVRTDDASWQELGRRAFSGAYCDENSVYEQLQHDPPSR